MDDQDTPRAKRVQRDGLQSPSLTDSRGALDLDDAVSFNAPSSHSSQQTKSRSSSPSKRRRTLAIQFSGPILRSLDVGEVAEWRAARNTTEIPLLDELFACIANTEDGGQTSLKDEDVCDIHMEVKRCLRRNAPEDSWSDWVVLPAMKLARKVSTWGRSVDIVNVYVDYIVLLQLLTGNRKTIDISPTTLVSGPYKKRVDYSFGLEVADLDTTLGIRQSLEHYTMSQSDHWILNDRALFCHLEIKAESDTANAESQLKVWCTAGFRKQERMYKQARRSESAAPALAPQPLWVWEKDKVHLSIAVMDLVGNRIYFLSQKTFLIEQGNPNSLRPVLQTMTTIMNWGYTHYLPWFRELIGRAELNERPGE